VFALIFYDIRRKQRHAILGVLDIIIIKASYRGMRYSDINSNIESRPLAHTLVSLVAVIVSAVISALLAVDFREWAGRTRWKRSGFGDFSLSHRGNRDVSMLYAILLETSNNWTSKSKRILGLNASIDQIVNVLITSE
jgi:hypothetical protein